MVHNLKKGMFYETHYNSIGHCFSNYGANGHPHQFRHSFAVNWLRNNGDIIILHRILGHTKIQTTMEYLKIVPTDQGKELLKINFD